MLISFLKRILKLDLSQTSVWWRIVELLHIFLWGILFIFSTILFIIVACRLDLTLDLPSIQLELGVKDELLIWMMMMNSGWSMKFCILTFHYVSWISYFSYPNCAGSCCFISRQDCGALLLGEMVSPWRLHAEDDQGVQQDKANGRRQRRRRLWGCLRVEWSRWRLVPFLLRFNAMASLAIWGLNDKETSQTFWCPRHPLFDNLRPQWQNSHQTRQKPHKFVRGKCLSVHGSETGGAAEGNGGRGEEAPDFGSPCRAQARAESRVGGKWGRTFHLLWVWRARLWVGLSMPRMWIRGAPEVRRDEQPRLDLWWKVMLTVTLCSWSTKLIYNFLVTSAVRSFFVNFLIYNLSKYNSICSLKPLDL